MIADARKAGLPDRLDADLVIVGAGPAGITLALALAGSGLDIVLLEAGGARYSRTIQDFYRGEAVRPSGHSPVELYRRRVLGGSTSIWGGRCIPFDAIDFEDRPWMKHARWPIPVIEVQARIPRAMEMLEAGLPEFSGAAAFSSGLTGLPSDPDLILDRIERFSKPTDFGRRYRQKLASAVNIRLFTHAPVTEVLLDDRRCTGVRFDASGRSVSLAAARTVIACGGIETARLLLAGSERHPQGIGNERDLVGRFYQCHLEGKIGSLQLSDAAGAAFGYERTRDGVYGRRYLWLSPEAQRRERLAGLVLRPTHPDITDPAHRDPVLSAMFLAKSFIVPEYARKLTALENRSLRKGVGGIGGHLANVAIGAPRLAAFATDWTWRRVLADRKLPSVVLRDPRGCYEADVNGEQEPNPESRVMLGAERDALGMRRVRVEWRATGADMDRLARGLSVMADALERSGAGRLDLSGVDAPALRQAIVPIGGHHVGTARMAADPSQGVCDPNGEVFSAHGLYVAGAALFPTSGFANPTLTLVALTLRLADHLRTVTGRQPVFVPVNETSTQELSEGAVHA